MAEARAAIDQWAVDPDRAFMRGADLRGWMGWHGIELDKLSPGELVRLAALVQVFEQHPGVAARVPTYVLWIVVGRYGQQRRRAA